MKANQSHFALFVLSAIFFVAPLCAMDKESKEPNSFYNPFHKDIWNVSTPLDPKENPDRSLLVLQPNSSPIFNLPLDPTTLNNIYKSILLSAWQCEKKGSKPLDFYKQANMECFPWYDMALIDRKEEIVNEEIKKYSLKKIKIALPPYISNEMAFGITISGRQFKLCPELLSIRAPNLLNVN